MDSSTGAGIDVNAYRAMIDDDGGRDPDDDIEAHRLRPTDHAASTNDNDNDDASRSRRSGGDDDGDGATLWSAHGGDRFQWPPSTEYDAFFRAVGCWRPRPPLCAHIPHVSDG